MRILAPEIAAPGRVVEVTFETGRGAADHAARAPRGLRAGGASVFFRSSQPVLSGNLESFLALGLLPSMAAGDGPAGRLIADGDVSRAFLAGLSAIQYIYTLWDASLGRVDVEGVRPVARPTPAAGRAGLFFSGGVDSLYSLVTRQNEITDLVFVHGFDIPLGNVVLREKVARRIREAAAAFGKNLVEIETNVRDVLDPCVEWGRLGHGAALAAVGHLLSPVLGRLFIASSHTYPHLDIWGSHPVLDPLWSSESLEFVHDGHRTRRVDKVARLANCDVAMRTLRVCWQNPDDAYNCGRCEKCLRTMINLRVNGALDRCTTFPGGLDLEAVMSMKVDREGLRILTQDNLDALRRTTPDDPLATALETLLGRTSASSRARRRIEGAAHRLARWLAR